MKYIHSKETITIPDGGTFAQWEEQEMLDATEYEQSD
jgi:hypothetical protein